MPINYPENKKNKKRTNKKSVVKPEPVSTSPLEIEAANLQQKNKGAKQTIGISKKMMIKIMVLVGIVCVSVVIGYEMTVLLKTGSIKNLTLTLDTTYGTRKDKKSSEFFNGVRVMRSDWEGYVFLVDPDLKKILVWNTQENKFIMAIDHQSVEEKRFIPGDITRDQEGRYYVLDGGTNKIIRLSAEGKREHHWPALFYRSIAMLPNGTLAALDAGKNQLVIWDVDGKELRRFGKKGEKKGQFLGPLRLTVDSQGRIIVLDAKLKRVQIFNAKGNLLHAWPVDFTPTINTPIEVYGDQILSADYQKHKICFYSYKGKLENTVERLYPGTCTVDNQQRIYMPYALGVGSYTLE
jgi:hypothetical protein